MIKKDKFFRASKLRKFGYSLREISEKLKISKSTASLWMREQKISDSGKKRLENLSIKGREKSKIILQKKRINRIEKIEKECTVLSEKTSFRKDDLKLMLALLYWCEGGKTDRRVTFINSDHNLIKSFLKLLRKSFIINENKLKALLHLHEYHNRKEMLEYWTNITGIKPENISVYNKKNSGKRKRDNYKGCISIRYGDSKVLDEIMLIIKRFIFAV
ncbi:MAG: hypothetical protein Q8O59_01200 [bacterium]|nr:hypothetical protein [bacterium]